MPISLGKIMIFVSMNGQRAIFLHTYDRPWYDVLGRIISLCGPSISETGNN